MCEDVNESRNVTVGECEAHCDRLYFLLKTNTALTNRERHTLSSCGHRSGLYCVFEIQLVLGHLL